MWCWVAQVKEDPGGPDDCLESFRTSKKNLVIYRYGELAHLAFAQSLCLPSEDVERPGRAAFIVLRDRADRLSLGERVDVRLPERNAARMRIYAIIALAGAVTAYVPPPAARDAAKRGVAAQSTLERPVLQATVEETENKNNVLNLPESEKITLETPLEAGRRGPSTSSSILEGLLMLYEKRRPRLRGSGAAWDIYADNVQLADPSGVQTRGLQNYKQFFGVIRMFRRVMIDKVDITFKLRYDWSKQDHQGDVVLEMVRAWLFQGGLRRRDVLLPPRRPGEDFQARSGTGPGRRAASQSALLGRVARVPGVRPRGPRRAVTRAELRLRGVAGRAGRACTDVGVRRRVFRGAAGEKKAPRSKEKKQKRKLLPGQCEGMWDCDSPMECCDFADVRCRGGVGIPRVPRAAAGARADSHGGTGSAGHARRRRRRRASARTRVTRVTPLAAFDAPPFPPIAPRFGPVAHQRAVAAASQIGAPPNRR